MGLVKNYSEKTEEIIEYLKNNPEFFTKHPEILQELKIPHETGENVSSLIEYQVIRLRQKIIELEQSINDLEEDTKSKREHAKYMHGLLLSLLKADDYQKLFDTLNKELKNYYGAKQVLLYIFKREGLKDNYKGLRFVDPDSKLKFMFTEILHRKKPLCGSLQEEHIKALFKENHHLIHSTILIPLKEPGWEGLLVLGSSENNCYSHGFKLDLLVYLTQVLGLVIETW